MTRKKYYKGILYFLCFIALLPYFLTVTKANAEESLGDGENSSLDQVETFTVSYGKGLYISYDGKEPNNFIKGQAPTSQTVTKGGSVTVSQSSYTFRDYSFGGWRYTYTDESGNKKNKYYKAGDVIENITRNMKLEATWTKKKEVLKVDAYLVYANSNKSSKHYVGEITVLGKSPTAPSDKHVFCGWTDNEGTVLYKAGDEYEIKQINTVIKPVWSVDGEQIDYKKVSVSATSGGSASLTQIYLLSGTSQKITFTPDEGYFLSSVKINGVETKAETSISVKVENEDIYIDAVFQKINVPSPEESSADEEEEYTVSVSIDGNGKVSPETPLTVKKNSNLTLTFTADANFSLPESIVHNEKEVFFTSGWDGKYVIENINENQEISISFIPKNNVVSAASEVSDVSDDDDTTSNFTTLVCVGVVLIAIIFALISVSYVNRTKKSKRKSKKSSKSK